MQELSFILSTHCYDMFCTTMKSNEIFESVFPLLSAFQIRVTAITQEGKHIALSFLTVMTFSTYLSSIMKNTSKGFQAYTNLPK